MNTSPKTAITRGDGPMDAQSLLVWDIDLFFDVVTYRPQSIAFCIEGRFGTATVRDVTPLYFGPLRPNVELAALAVEALEVWHRAKYGRSAA